MARSTKEPAAVPQPEFPAEALDALIGPRRSPEALEAMFRQLKKRIVRIPDGADPKCGPQLSGHDAVVKDVGQAAGDGVRSRRELVIPCNRTEFELPVDEQVRVRGVRELLLDEVACLLVKHWHGPP